MLRNSTSYKRSTAYFSGVLYSAVTASVKDFFIENSGKMQLVTSPVYDLDHIKTFKMLDNTKESSVDESLYSIFEQLEQEKNKELSLKLLSALIRDNLLNLKIATPINEGIHHEKIGIFEDLNQDSISFSGSVNETLFGWSKNNEQIRVFKSWESDEHPYFKIDEKQFMNLWKNNLNKVKVSSLSDGVLEEIIKYSKKESLEGLVEQVKEEESYYFPSKQTDTSIEGEVQYMLMDHQKKVLSSWEDQGYKGIVKFATGAGKTFVGIESIKRHFERKIDCTAHALVVVPSVLLQEQWISEINKNLPGYRVQGIGGEYKKSKWLNTLSYTSSREYEKNTIFVSTLDSLLTEEFFASFDFGENILLIFDEVHRAGSEKAKLLLQKESGSRLGLSATPERYGDEEGTEEIFEYFGDTLSPEFTLKDSIDVGRLVPYSYNILSCKMSEKEQEEYDKITNKIIGVRNLLEKQPRDLELENSLKLMYIQRAKIPKKAIDKVDITFQILEQYHTENSYWLIYCEDHEQLDKIVSRLHNGDYDISIYTSSMNMDRKEVLEKYKLRGGIMVAIRCLDEGIDIPYLENAIILASSQNPREFIQRRGRILRKNEGKSSAQLFDVMVTPREYNPSNDYADTLIVKELKRAYEFSKTASNEEVLFKVKNIAREYGVNIEDLTYDEEESKEVDVQLDEIR